MADQSESLEKVPWLSEFLSQVPDFLVIGLEFGLLVGGLALLNKLWKAKELSNPEQRYLRLLGLCILAVAGIILIILQQPKQGASIDHVITLLGVFLSGAIALSSTTFISNFMAGIMLSRIGNYHPGDFLSVGEHIGRVTKMGLLHTEIQTEHSDLMTFPNLYLVTQPYKVVRKSKTVVSASVSLGYDVPHTKVKELLVKAVEEVPLVEPFVQIMELGDFSVVYRAAGILENAKKLISTRSKLREEMLDALHGAGVEIVSPNFMNTRALSVADQILSPADDSEPDPSVDGGPESVIFDMADKAESIENIRRRREVLQQEIATLKETIKAHSQSDTNNQMGAQLSEKLDSLEREIAWRESSIVFLERRIEKADSEGS